MASGNLICIAIVLLMAAMSWRADRRLRHVERLPMQWGFNGKPTWYAPRRLALAFSPLLAIFVLGLFSIGQPLGAASEGAMLDKPRLIMGFTFVLIHWFHLYLAEKECL